MSLDPLETERMAARVKRLNSAPAKRMIVIFCMFISFSFRTKHQLGC
jgi:hypothetical protein